MDKSQRESTDRSVSDEDLAGKFAYWMMLHNDSLYRYLFSLHPFVDEVDDLLQETALTLWKKIDEYDQEREFLPWALRVAYFEVLRWRKHMRKRRFVFSQEIIQSIKCVTSTQNDEWSEARRKALQDCMTRLSAKQRTVVKQRYERAGSLKGLATDLGVSPHKIYRTLQVARQSLVDCVGKKMKVSGFMVEPNHD